MGELRLDGHKLMYHVPRLYQWYKGENIYPIYIEIGLHGGCNHRCIFCAFDFLKYKPQALDVKCLNKFIIEAARKKVKAVLFSGEGEPLLHNHVAEIISFTKNKGIDVALSTNGIMLGKERSDKILGYLTWIRVSVNAGTKKGYAFIHGTKKEDFNKVINNLKVAVKIKNRRKYKCTIGVQFLLMPQNYKEVLKLASILKSIGVDYLVVKPYSQHPSSKNKFSFRLKSIELYRLQEQLMKYSNNNFKIIFRNKAIKKMEEDKPYKYCLGLPFATHIASDGSIYPCNTFVGNKKFKFGNICDESFKNIWEGRKRKDIMKMIYNKWDIKECRKSCRIDEINRYLWELKNPGKHINFI